MAAVYAGVHEELGLTAAVKLLPPGLAHQGGFRARFESEIETLRQLEHPHIVRLFGFGEQDGLLFYAMERVEGDTLEKQLAEGRRFDWEETVDVALEICHALHHAHVRGIIHRDLKPGNVMISTDDRVMLTDFGIARLWGFGQLTSEGGMVGTANYMAPEQADNRGVSERSDLYALGALMYTLLAGRPPFVADSFDQMIHLQKNAEPEPVSKHVPQVPHRLDQLIMRLLRKDPQQRISSARALANRLEEIRDEARAELAAAPTIVTDASGSPQTDETISDAGTDAEATVDEGSRAEVELPGTQIDRFGSSHFTTAAQATQAHVERTADDAPSARFFDLQLLGLLAVLGALGAGIWHFTRPLTADQLYQRISSRIDSGELTAAGGDLAGFLKRFPEDSRAGELRGYREEIDLRRLERRLTLQARQASRGGSLTPVERAYLTAARAAESDPSAGARKFQALIDLFGAETAEPSARTRQCLALARRQLRRLARQGREEDSQRVRYLRGRVDAAAELAKTDSGAARTILLAVLELYAQEPAAASLIDRARDILKSLPPPAPPPP